MSGPAVVTIAADNYLAHARVLRDSLRRFHPDLPFFLALAAEDALCLRARAEGFDVLGLAELAPPGLERMRRRYDAKALCAALKPTALRRMLERGFAPVIFLDPDILVTSGLETVLEECSRHPLTLTPHWTTPPRGIRGLSLERRVLLAGTYNGGFIGVMPDAAAAEFLSWWESRLSEQCVCELERGIHYDQRWLDLATGFVPEFHLLRDPGCNVAYWNLEGRRVERRADRWLVDGEPLRFFHFSGFDPANPGQVTRFEPGLLASELGDAGSLFLAYGNLLRESGVPL